ncbi:hypothetical protein CKF54_00145 [Psittacicella hinzii]|uniref:Arsenate reductase n=1 Tax=Psittacicella hinzii TaxID=2028575 RepID=A0A3A1YBH4_9GAMM|nr:ArsC/Spx/MgsR family protein [Psittacicella hinzii]RIY34569.1 hypothetical protein CKF54_00145 [Psittacicella hinzii]
MTESITVYGIKTCTTVRLHIKVLKEQGFNVDFHDYLSQGVDKDKFTQALQDLGWDQVINLRARNFATLGAEAKEYFKQLAQTKNHEFDEKGFALVQEQPRIIKRPLVERNGHFQLN